MGLFIIRLIGTVNTSNQLQRIAFHVLPQRVLVFPRKLPRVFKHLQD